MWRPAGVGGVAVKWDHATGTGKMLALAYSSTYYTLQDTVAVGA